MQEGKQRVIFTVQNKEKHRVMKNINWTKVAFFGIPAVILIATIYAAFNCSSMYY